MRAQNALRSYAQFIPTTPKRLNSTQLFSQASKQCVVCAQERDVAMLMTSFRCRPHSRLLSWVELCCVVGVNWLFVMIGYEQASSQAFNQHTTTLIYRDWFHITILFFTPRKLLLLFVWSYNYRYVMVICCTYCGKLSLYHTAINVGEGAFWLSEFDHDVVWQFIESICSIFIINISRSVV